MTPRLSAQFEPWPCETWDVTGALDGYVVKHYGEVVARAPTFDKARDIYNAWRSKVALSRETLRHTLSEKAQ